MSRRQQNSGLLGAADTAAKDKSRGLYLSSSCPPNSGINRTRSYGQKRCPGQPLPPLPLPLFSALQRTPAPLPFEQTWTTWKGFFHRSTSLSMRTHSCYCPGSPEASVATEQNIATQICGFLLDYVPWGSALLLLEVFWGECLNSVSSLKAISERSNRKTEFVIPLWGRPVLFSEALQLSAKFCMWC